jgi:hypothetical protein
MKDLPKIALIASYDYIYMIMTRAGRVDATASCSQRQLWKVANEARAPKQQAAARAQQPHQRQE